MLSSRLPRIGIVITNLSASGAERITLNIAEMFSAHGYPVDVFLLENKVDFFIDPAIKLHYLSAKRRLHKSVGILGDQLLANKLNKIITRIETTSQTKFGLFLSNLPAADKVTSLCKLANTWHCIHSSYSGEITEFKKQGRPLRALKKQRLYKRLYKNKKLIAVSQGVENDIRQTLKIQAREIKQIYNPFNFDTLRELSNKNDIQLPNDKFIVHAGAYRPVKRHDILLEAFSHITQDIKLVLLTDRCQSLEKLINAFNLKDRVIIAGHQRNPYPFMKAAKLMVLSSEREGLPTVMIESLILGTAVVSTDCTSGPREILTNELSQWLTPVNEPLALAHKIDQALSSTITVSESLIAKFASEHVYKKYLELIASPNQQALNNDR